MLAVLGLAACSSSSGGGDDSPGIVSSGILELEFPTAAERADIPDELNALIDNVQTANEEGVALTPSGDATYTGTFGLGVDNESATLVSGDVTAVFDLATSTMNATFTPTEIIDPDNPTVSGSFEAVGMVVTDGRYSGGVAGNVLVDGVENVSVGGDLIGATTADNETFGAIEGVLSSSQGGDSAYGGYFYAK